MKFGFGWLNKTLPTGYPPRVAGVVAPKESAALKARGDGFFNQYMMKEAIDCYRQAIALDPDHAEAYNNLGNALRELKQFDEAERCYTLANVIAPDLVNACYNFGSMLQELGRLNEAIAQFNRVLELKPDLEAAYLSLSYALFQSGQCESARKLINRGLAINPDSTGLNNSLGNMDYHEKNFAQAVVCYRKVLSIQPDNVAAVSNLGRVLVQMGRLEEAITCFLKATALNPRDADLHYDMAGALQQRGKLDEAVASYRKAISMKPDHADAHLYLGDALRKQKNLEEARICCERALAIKPDWVIALNCLGFILRDQGKLEEALTCFQKSITLDPENGMARHLIALLSGSNPEHAPAQYVEMLFDGYAENFDSHLLGKLEYGIPAKLANLIARHSISGSGRWDVLDLGCGTGLVGLELAHHAQQLVGVDLSAKMLEKAAARNLYHRLVHMGVLDMMQAEPDMSYDLIVAADVLIYVGKLDGLAIEMKRLLSAGGKFAFSIESLTEETSSGTYVEYLLNRHTGRYTHSPDYLVRLASENGFRVLEMMLARIRINEGKPVHGYLGLWEKLIQ